MINGSYWIIGKFNVRGALLPHFYRLVGTPPPYFDQWNVLIRGQRVGPSTEKMIYCALGASHSLIALYALPDKHFLA